MFKFYRKVEECASYLYPNFKKDKPSDSIKRTIDKFILNCTTSSNVQLVIKNHHLQIHINLYINSYHRKILISFKSSCINLDESLILRIPFNMLFKTFAYIFDKFTHQFDTNLNITYNNSNIEVISVPVRVDPSIMRNGFVIQHMKRMNIKDLGYVYDFGNHEYILGYSHKLVVFNTANNVRIMKDNDIPIQIQGYADLLEVFKAIC